MPPSGPPNVVDMESKRDIHGLIKALSYTEDAVIRFYAAAALGNIEDSQAVEPLIAALNDIDKEVRAAVEEALGKIGDARAVELLLDLLEHGSYQIRVSAGKSLVRMYKSDKVSDLQKKLILKERYFIISGHHDKYHIHTDIMTGGGEEIGISGNCGGSPGIHDDRIDNHQDEGIGVDFPL